MLANDSAGFGCSKSAACRYFAMHYQQNRTIDDEDNIVISGIAQRYGVTTSLAEACTVRMRSK